MKRFIYILFFAVVFSYFCSIRAEAVDLDSPPMPNDYMSGDDTDKDEGFYEWLGDYATYLYLYGDNRDPAELEQEFKNCVHQVANQYGESDVEDHINENLENISKSKKNIGQTLKDVYNVLNDSFSNWLIPSGNSSGHGSGFNANQGAPSGGTSYPLSNGGQIVVNDFGSPMPPHSVDLYNDSMENNYCLLEVLSYDRHGNVIDSYYLCTAEIYASDAYITNPLSFDGGIYQGAWGAYYIDFSFAYHNASLGNINDNRTIQVDVTGSGIGGADPAELPSLDPNGSSFHFPEGGWINGRSCILGHDDDGNPCIMFSDDGSIWYPNKDGTFTVDGNNYYLTLNYNTLNDLHKQDVADNLKAGAVYLTLLANSGSDNGQDYSVILQYIADKLDENNSILTLMASDDFLSHILSLLGLAAGFMDENQITEFIPLLLSLSNKIVALLPYDCISAAMGDIENTLFSNSPIDDLYVWINGERYVLLSASFAATCQTAIDIVKTLCALVIVYMWLINMRKKVVTF